MGLKAHPIIYFAMAAPNKKFSLILFIWPATLVAAFLVGRLTLINDPTVAYQTTLESAGKGPAPESKEVSRVRNPQETEKVVVLGETDPLLLIRNAIAESDPLKRMSMLTDAFSRLTKDNIMDGFALLDSMPDGQLKRQMESLLLNTWGKLEGPAAMDYVLNKQAGEGNDRGSGRGRGGYRWGGGDLRDTLSVMSGWAETDPRAAVAWAAQNGTDDTGRNTMLMSALQGWANTDIEGAINYAMTEGQSITTDGRGGRGGRGGGMENFLINRFVSEDPQAATQWALSQSDPQVRKDAIASTARSLANHNPEEATLWAQSIPDSDAKLEALAGTASGWAREDPQAAMNWALNIEDSTTSSQAVTSALSTWAREDPYGASDYVINMEPGAEKDLAASTLTRNLVREDPEMALLWAESISDPSLQMETLSPIATGWMRKDPAKAIEWIQSSGLAEETKQALLAPKQP